MHPNDPGHAVARWNAAAASYEDTTEKRTAFFLDGLLRRLSEPDRDFVVDVACGTGIVTLALAEQGSQVFAIDHSPAMVARTEARLAERGLESRVRAVVADAMRLDLPTGRASAAVSNHGVIFCPDVAGAILEMARVTRPGGVVALTAWTKDLQFLFDLDPQLGFPVPAPEGFAFSDIAELKTCLVSAGLVGLQVEEVPGPSIELPSWEATRAMLKSPAFATMFDGLDAAQSTALEQAILKRVRAEYGEGPIRIARKAWIASGRVPGTLGTP